MERIIKATFKIVAVIAGLIAGFIIWGILVEVADPYDEGLWLIACEVVAVVGSYLGSLMFVNKVELDELLEKE